MSDDVELRFEAASLEIIERHSSGQGVTVAEAFQRVVHTEATPVAKIARTSPDFADRVNEAWVASDPPR